MKKIFTLFAVAMMAMGANAQEKVLFSNDGAYGNGATLTSENLTVVLGNDRTTKNYDLKLSSAKAYCAELFGQTVPVTNEETGEVEQKTRVVYVVGNQNPKDGELDGDASKGSGYKPESCNLPHSGTYYMITPAKAGHICAFVIVNGGKNFYIAKGSDGTCLPVSDIVIKKDGDEAEVVPMNDDFTLDDKTTGTVEFDVVANETYYVFCTGSKLSFGGCVFTPEGGVDPGELTETTLWEGSVSVNGWADQPFLLSDGGAELKAVNAKAGDIVRFYMTAPDQNWQVELFEGHWTGMYVRWSELPLTNEDGSERESVIVDLTNKGYADFELTDAVLEAAYTSGGWGGVFLLNGDGNLTCTKLTILQAGGGPGPQPEGVKIDIMDKFTSNWGEASGETNTHNADGTITYNGVQWGGLSAWLCDEDGNTTDWSKYIKLVFEFAEPTPAACQGFIQCLGDNGDDVNNTWWGNAGISKLECPFEDKDMTKVKQACLQAADNATYQISAIYLVADADGIQETVMVSNKMMNNAIYNLAGMKVNSDYKGIVIQNGRKFIQK